MAINAYGATSLTGGGTGALDDIIHTNINDGDMAIVIDHANETAYLFTYDSGSSTAEDVSATADTLVVQPDSNAGNGRWIGCKMGSTQWDEMRDFITATSLSAALAGLGLQYTHEWIPSTYLLSQTTDGITFGSDEQSTYQVMTQYAIFAGGTEDYAQFDMVLPDTWDTTSTIKAKFYWKPATGASAGDTVIWALQAAAFADDDDLDGLDFGTAQTVTDTVLAGAETDEHQSDALGTGITIAGSPAAGERVVFRVYRNGSAGGDTMTENAYLIGIVLELKHTEKVSAW